MAEDGADLDDNGCYPILGPVARRRRCGLLKGPLRRPPT